MNFEITELSDFSGEMAHIYSVTLKGDEQTLLEQFFDENAEYKEELGIIVEKLLVMGNECKGSTDAGNCSTYKHCYY